jgi:sugar lactone lactonase YvrE
MLGRHGLIGKDTDLTRYGGVLSVNEGARRAASVNGGAPMGAYAYDTSNVTGITGAVRQVRWGKNGDRAYVTILGNSRTAAAVHQLNLSTPYDLASRSNPTKSVVVGDWFTNCNAVTFNAAGTKMYVGGYNGTSLVDERVIEFDLSTAWELDSATPVVKKFYIGGDETAPRGFTFRPDGTRLYMIGITGDDINQYDLSTAWDIGTAGASATRALVPLVAALTTPTSVVFKDDGTKCYVLNSGNDVIYQFSLGTAWDVSGAFTYDNVSLTTSTQEATPIGIFIGNNGADLYVSGTIGDNIVRYTMSTAWDLSTATFTSESTGTGDSSPSGLFFRDNGAVVYVAATFAGTIRTYNLTGAAWDTGSTNLSFDDAVGPIFSQANTNAFYDVFIGDNGTKLYWLDDGRDCIYQAPLGTAWDVSSVEGMAMNASLNRYDSILLVDGGTKLFAADASTNISRYTLSTANRLHTAGARDQDVNMGVGLINGIEISADGRKLYVVGTNSFEIYRFTLPTPFSLTGFSLDGKITPTGDIGTGQTPDFSDVSVNPDATHIEVWCSAGATLALHRYKLRF